MDNSKDIIKTTEVLIEKQELKEILLKGMGRNQHGLSEMLGMLKGYGNTIPITEGVMETIILNIGWGDELMSFLFKKGGDGIPMTEKIVKAAVQNTSKGAQLISLFFEQRGDTVPITEEVVKAAVQNISKGAQLISLFFEQRGDTVPITEEVVKLAVQNRSVGDQLISLFFEQRGDTVPITEEVVKAAVQNTSSGAQLISLFFEQRGDTVPITEEVVKLAVQNRSLGDQLISLFFEQRGNSVLITEEVVRAATQNTLDGARLISLFFEQRGDTVPITEEVVKAAVQNISKGAQLISLFFEQRGDTVPITEEVVKLAVQNRSVGDQLISLFFEQRGDTVPITEEVVKVAVQNWLVGDELISLFFKQRGNSVPITEEVVRAATQNTLDGARLISLFFEQRGDTVPITEEVVKAAVQNISKGAQLISLFFKQRGNSVPITEEVVKLAVQNRSVGDQLISLFFEQRGDTVPITEEVVKAAVQNRLVGDELISLFFKQRGNSVPITEEVVKLAVQNTSKGDQLISLFFEQRGDTILITEEVVKAAVRNLPKGENILSLFLQANVKFSEGLSWIHTLTRVGYGVREIVDLLWNSVHDSPWIFFDPTYLNSSPMEIQSDGHIPGCCHEVVLHSPLTTQAPIFYHHSTNVNHDRMIQQLQELCGLAGITPTTRNMSDWIGSIHFSNGNHSISASYALATDETRLPDFEIIWSRVSRALSGLCHALALAQTSNFCCNSFTVMKQGLNESSRIYQGEAVSVPFQSVKTLSDAFKQVSMLHFEQPGLATVMSASEAILALVWPDIAIFQRDLNLQWCLHICALTVQFLCVGFLSYSQAHIGPLKLFFLESSLRRMTLTGFDKEFPYLIAEFVELTCLGEMTNGPVLIFRAVQHSSQHKELEEPHNQLLGRKYDILGRAEDILDTWGPGCLMFQSTSHILPIAIKMGKGFIIAENSGKCHWSKEIEDIEGLCAINIKEPFLVGSLVTKNATCGFQEKECWRRAESVFSTLGTGPSIYASSQRQVGIGPSQFATGQVSQTWNKQPGVTCKDILIDFSSNIIQYMDHYWGVQVSYCTGVARRVPLRTLVADLMPHFCIASKLDPCLVERKLRDESQGPKELLEWINTLGEVDRTRTLDTIFAILRALGPTGLDLTGKYLCVAWPLEGADSRCFKIRLEGNSSWAKFLEDSHDFATFAYVTMQCFETTDIKCSRDSPEACRNIHILETSVFRDQAHSNQTPLQHDQVYFFSKLDGMFWVKVLKESKHQLAFLVSLETIWSAPFNIRQRLYWNEYQKNRGCLRERTTVWAPGEVVSVVSGRRRR